MIIYGILEPCFAAKVTLRCLYETWLTGIGSARFAPAWWHNLAQVLLRPCGLPRKATVLGVPLDDCPDHFWREAVSPNSTCLVDRTKERTTTDSCRKDPGVDRRLTIRNGIVRMCPPLPSGQQLPNGLAKLEVLQSQSRQLSRRRPQPTRRASRARSLAARRGTSSFQQPLAFFRRQPVSNTYSQPLHPLTRVFQRRDRG